MQPTCEICDTEELCLAGRCPCSLCGEFIADVPKEIANKMLEQIEAPERLAQIEASRRHEISP